MKTNRSKTVLVIVLSVIVIVAAVAGIMLAGKHSSNDQQAGAVRTAESVVISEDEVAKDRLLKDKYPEINDLIKRYREALVAGDVDALKKIYNTTDEISSDVLSSTSKIIEGYSNTVCYTKKGLEESSFFVFIYDELKIRDISTPAPNLTMVYVKSAEDGEYYIYRGEKTGAMYDYDAATKAYIENLYEDDEVKDLMATVYQEKEAACAKDEALRNFIDGLSVPETEETSEGGETQQSESETETSGETEAVES